MQSCDTFVLGKNYYAENCILFAKNSDRPLGETQPLTLVPGGDHLAGEMLRCAHLTIPQAAHTYTVLGSRPYWIWGFEMGCNEMGLVIGNEAENSRCEPETEEGMLGMDMLRLALERCATAREAIRCIAQLLETYGQSANAHPHIDRRYENSFLMADRQEIWLLETAGRKWVAKQISDWTAISNCYSIGTDYDLSSPDLVDIARQNRWQHPNETFNFTKAYTAPTGMQTGAIPRWRRMKKLIDRNGKPLSLTNVKAIMRDHFEEELNEPRFGGTYGTFATICMHAMNGGGSQTAASMLWKWDDALGCVVCWAPSLPCCSVYLPIYLTGYLPKAITIGGEFFDENALWWQAERLAMAISADENRFGPRARAVMKALEKKLTADAEQAETDARALMAAGNSKEAYTLLNRTMDSAVEETSNLFCQLWEEIGQQLSRDGGLYGQRKGLLEAYSRRVNMSLIPEEK